MAETWDEEQAYDEKIAPLMTQVIAICKEHRIPVFASFAYRRDEDTGETSFCTTSLPFKGRDVEVLQRAARMVYDNARSSAFAIVTFRPGAEKETPK